MFDPYVSLSFLTLYMFTGLLLGMALGYCLVEVCLYFCLLKHSHETSLNNSSVTSIKSKNKPAKDYFYADVKHNPLNLPRDKVILNQVKSETPV